MDSNRDSIITDENIDIILDLLDEYSTKLRAMVQILQDQLQRQTFIRAFTLILFLTSVAVVMLTLGISDLRTAYVIVGGLSFIIIILFVFLYYYGSALIELELLKEDIMISIKQLTKVIKIASQIEDHTSQKLSRELKLQLRLAESEGVIRLAYHIIKAH